MFEPMRLEPRYSVTDTLSLIQININYSKTALFLSFLQVCFHWSHFYSVFFLHNSLLLFFIVLHASFSAWFHQVSFQSLCFFSYNRLPT